MHEYLGPLTYLGCLFVPLTAIIVGAALFMLVPLVKAAKPPAIARAARIYLKEHEDTTRPRVERYLRNRFVPDLSWQPPEIDWTLWLLFALLSCGLALMVALTIVLFGFLAQMRTSLITTVIHNRITQVLDDLDVGPGESGPRRPRRARRSD